MRRGTRLMRCPNYQDSNNYKEYKHFGFTIQHDIKNALEAHFERCWEEMQIQAGKAGKEDVFVHPDIVCEKNGSQYLFEVKSGRFSNYHFDQAALYKYILSRSGKPTYTALVYTESKEVYTDSMDLAKLFKRLGFSVHYNAHYFINGWQMYILLRLNAERDSYNKGAWCFSCANPVCPVKKRIMALVKELDVPVDSAQAALDSFSEQSGGQ